MAMSDNGPCPICCCGDCSAPLLIAMYCNDNVRDDERFCGHCGAGVDSNEHHEKCVIPGLSDDGRATAPGTGDVT